MLLTAGLLFACKSNTAKSNKVSATFTPDFNTSGPPALVYKTKADYSNLVPVMLSDDKAVIISYPHPSDLGKGDAVKTPTALKQGYWLDNKGIGKNVAFLKLTYAEYAALKEAPSLEEMMGMIVDKDPLTEMCNCGNKAALSSAVDQLNNLIDSGTLRLKCLPVK